MHTLDFESHSKNYGLYYVYIYIYILKNISNTIIRPMTGKLPI